ncbi:hypothetical protein [uncultured Tenacibaculum sp.]|uniref:hypothetical protein n=1 Tax=uncultured Tenacibaculum sp. TaxID=174713 RepID=UPI002620E3AD|nr:hypothetical protein [uncultured Tenacibaculum sp.]
MRTIKNFIFSTLVILVFTACASSKHKLVKTSQIEKDTLISKSNSIDIKTITKPIHDFVFIPIETGNVKIDSVIHKRFSNFSTYKKSGENSYKIKYNTSTKGFDITSEIAGTENSLVKKNDSLKNTQNKDVNRESEQIKIRYRLPGWLLILFLICLVAVYVLSKLRII